MALGTYSDLLASVGDWMARLDLLGNAPDFIALAEARLNRELNPVEVETVITGTIDSRSIDISALGVEEPIALFLSRPNLNEAELTQKAAGTFPIVAVSGMPRYWDREQETIGFDRPLNDAYPFRFRYSQYFRLSNTVPTNWLLTNHPDVYLAASLVWGGLYIQNNQYAAQFQAVLNSGLPEVRHMIAQSKRAILTVDPMLQRIGQPLRGYYNGSQQEWP